MKTELINLYNDAVLLGKYIEMENVTNRMLPALYPGRELDELSNEELIALTNSIITGMISLVC